MSDLPITHAKYYAEITAIAEECLDQTESDNEDWLAQTIDGHEFVIYTAKAWAVCWHSQNDEAAFEDSVLAQNASGFSDIMTPCAYHAMMADVRERMASLEVEQAEREAAAND